MNTNTRIKTRPIVVTSSQQLESTLAALASEPAIAVDTESNSLYAYREQVCLIQISIPGADYIVDPLAGLDLSPLAPIFAASGTQKVFHAAEYDVMCLKRDFGFHFAIYSIRCGRRVFWAGPTWGWATC